MQGINARAARHARRLRRREPQRHVRRQSVPVGACTREVYELARRQLASICCRRRAPITRSGSTARRSSTASDGGEEPIYGRTYLPRKFKIAFAVPPRNDVDVFAQDLGFIAIVEDGRARRLQRRRRRRHGHDARRAGHLSAHRRRDRLLHAGAGARGRRGGGDDAARLRRPHRPQARAPQVHDRRPRPRLVQGRGRAAPRLRARTRRGRSRSPRNGDRFGWVEGDDGRWHLTLFIENGRVRDIAGRPRC